MLEQAEKQETAAGRMQAEKTASTAAERELSGKTTENSKPEEKESHAVAQEQQKHAGVTGLGPEGKEDSAAGKEDMWQEKRTAITVEPGAHVRYTVPVKIRPDKAGEETLIRFRVDNVLQDHYLCVSYDGELISRKKKRILAPGEMEQVVIRHSDLEKHPELSRIIVHIEAE